MGTIGDSFEKAMSKTMPKGARNTDEARGPTGLWRDTSRWAQDAEAMGLAQTLVPEVPDDGYEKLDLDIDPMSYRALDRQVGGGHYKDMKIQPIEYVVANNMGYCEANIVKYITRHHLKGGAEDIDKVIHYAQLLKEMKYGSD
jgi:hypothetical protein